MRWRTRVLGVGLALGMLAAGSSVPLAQSLAAAQTGRAVVNSQACPSGSASEPDGLTRLGASARCSAIGGPETTADVNRYNDWLKARQSAPFGTIDADAYSNALAQRNAIAAVQPVGTNNAAPWLPVGTDALYANDASFDPHKLGWGNLSGRVTAFAIATDKVGHWYESSVTGGVWETTDSAATWHSVGDQLPTQVVGALVWSPLNGGTLVVGTGDTAPGRYSTSGDGVYWSSDNGQTWNHATGILPGALSLRLRTDPSDKTNMTFYLASSAGLYRSIDGAHHFDDVLLPTAPNALGYTCAGKTFTDSRCFFANFVTDVVVHPADGTSSDGSVVAAVGWIRGQQGFLDQTTGVRNAAIPQAPQNGIYKSPTGAVSSFNFIAPSGFTATAKVGRVALGGATGVGQNHDVLVALVQDAQKLAGACSEVDSQVCGLAPSPTHVQSDVLDGIYASKDFGATWTQLIDAFTLNQCGTGSTLSKCGALGNLGSGVGVQAWYNEWIELDPTRTDALSKAPSRLAFGLEEVWENSTPLAMDGSTAPNQFRVIGRYWNSCTGLNFDPSPTPCTGTPPTGTTTHPDQHAGVFIPNTPDDGGVTLLVGNDGGAYKQSTSNLTDFQNLSWGDGQNHGLHNLLPYGVDVSKDGTILAGLQDNGTELISPNGHQEMVFGGDGFLTAIDPNNSLNQLEEYVGGRISVSADGGHTYHLKDPSHVDANFGATAQFSTPIQRDPLAGAHAVTGAQPIMETNTAYTTDCFNTSDPTCDVLNTSFEWKKVYDLGTTGGSPNSATAMDVRGTNIYAGFCANCYTNLAAPFSRGIATNVGGAAPPAFGTGDGWHIASAIGLPGRIITSVDIDPNDPSTVYVTEGTYLPRWIHAGVQGDPLSRAGTGHVFKSTDHGDHFTDITNNLPNAPANFSLVRNGQLLVATDVGVFISTDTNGGTYHLLGTSLPNAPVFHLTQDPGNPDVIVAASFGRGVYRYDFNSTSPVIPEFGRAAAAVLVVGAGALWATRRRRGGRRSVEGLVA